MHGGGDFNTDEKFDFVNFEMESMQKPWENHWFFKIFFPLKWFYLWLDPLVWKGFSSTLQMEDIPQLVKSKQVSYVYERFGTLWDFYKKAGKNRLLLTIYTLFGFDFALAGILMVFYSCLQVAIPTLMKEFLLRLMPLEPDYFSIMKSSMDNLLPPELSEGINSDFFRKNDWGAWVFMAATGVAYLLSFFFQITSMHISTVMGMKQRAVLSLAMYEKSLKLSNKARAEFDNGTIINYISTDTLRAERINMMFHFGWTSIFVFGGALYFLIDLVDWGALAVCMTPFLYSPIILVLLVVVIMMQKKSVKITDSRVKRMNEFLQGIKIIKFFAWEEAYTKIIKTIRAKEVKYGFAFMVLIAVFMTLFFSTPQIMAIAAFLTFFLVHGYLDPITIFTSFNYINLIQAPVTMFPMTLMGLVDTLVSMGRMQKLLEADELEDRVELPLEEGKSVIVVEKADFKWEAVKKAEVKHEPPKSFGEMMKQMKEKKEEKKKEKERLEREKRGELEMEERPFEVNDVNLDVKQGELVMVVGKVGSGKSSLLSGLLREMKVMNGTVEIRGKIAYCAQSSWIMNATLLDNVLFGQPLDEEKFEDVVRVCGLGSDLVTLKGGRMIEIGEKGINLSGGQRTRVSLARACYQPADVYILDDPLAAVDSHVGKHIFDECIMKFLAGKTRFLVTHQIQLCEQADLIVYMDGGKITEMGKFGDLMENPKGGFFKLITENLAKKDKSEEAIVKPKKFSVKKIKIDKDHKKVDLIQKEEKAKGVVGFDVIKSYISACGGWYAIVIIVIAFVAVQILMTGSQWFLSEWSNGTFNEEFGKTFNSPVYVNYTVVVTNATYNPMYGVWIPTDFEFYVSDEYTLDEVFEAFSVMGNESAEVDFEELSEVLSFFHWYDKKKYEKEYPGKGFNMTDCLFNIEDHNISSICLEIPIEIAWDMSWDNGTRIKDGMKQPETLSIYAGTGLGGVMLSAVRDMIFAVFCMVAAKKLHDGALKSIADAPLSFFDTTPIGRILNRFSTDFLTLDMMLVRVISMVVSIGFSTLGMFGLMGYATNGLFLPFLIPVFILYFLFYIFYRKTAIELKRLFSVSKSPLLSHISETLSGMHIIRAFGKVDEFLQENRKRIDVNNSTYYLMTSSQRWLMMRLQLVGFFIIVSVSSICIVLFYYLDDFDMTNLSYIAMGVSYSFVVSMMMSMVFMQLTEAEVMFNSVERVNHYKENVKGELDRHTKYDDEAGEDWPRTGKIEFKDYYMRYREHLPIVLRSVNLDIKTGERIGVVGRTGSGKSSLMIALFRLVEPLNGAIFIDGVDIATLGTKKLRKGISIIPQEPVLFSGTIRSNLDPFKEHDDEKLLLALKKAALEEAVERVGGLDGTVVAGGENFSAGERQLLCLARALLKSSKVLVLDECTASVDVATDKILQETIRENKESTILTIAHRLNTIIDYDRILVMDDGLVAEFDTPKNLLSMEKYSIFRELVTETGQSNSRHLLNQVFGEEYEQHMVNQKISGSFIELEVKALPHQKGFGERTGFPGLFDSKPCEYHLDEKFEVVLHGEKTQTFSTRFEDISSVAKVQSGRFFYFEMVIDGSLKNVKVLQQALPKFSELLEKKMKEAGVTEIIVKHKLGGGEGDSKDEEKVVEIIEESETEEEGEVEYEYETATETETEEE